MKMVSYILLKHICFGAACALTNKQLIRVCSLTLVFLLTAAIIPAKLFAYNHDHEERYGGTLRIGVGTKLGRIHPFYASSGLGMFTHELVFDSLLRVSLDNKVAPNLAESWECNDDSNYCDFKIRNDIYFHDGHKLDVNDILCTFDEIKKLDDRLKEMLFDYLDGYEVLDENTIRLNFKIKSKFALARLFTAILPQHVLSDGDLDGKKFEHSLIGSGPFKFYSRTENSFMLSAYENHYLGRPYFDDLSVTAYENNHELWGAMLKGAVDLALYLRPQDIKVLDDDADFGVVMSSLVVNVVLALNYSSELMKQVDLRRAIALAIDKKALINNMTAGYGLVGFKLFSDGREPFDSELYGFDVAKAKEIMYKLGFDYDDKKQVFLFDSKPLELKVLIFEEFEEYAKLAMLIRQQLVKLGIRLRVIKKSFLEIRSEQDLKVDMMLVPHLAMLSGEFLNEISAEKEDVLYYNFSPYSDVEYEQLIKKYKKDLLAGNSLADLEKRIERFYLDKVIKIPLYRIGALHAFRKDIKNVEVFFEDEDLKELMYLYKDK